MLIALGENEIRLSESLDTIRNNRNSMAVGMSRSEQQWRSDILSGTSNGNRLAGRVHKGGTFWLAELPALDVMTQGRTKDDAYAMVKDLLETLVNLPEFLVHVDPDEEGGFEVTSNGIGRRDPARKACGARPGLVAQPADST